MKQQTAVEWLLDRMEDVDLSESMWESIKIQARQTEKDQIVKAYDDGCKEGHLDHDPEKQGEEYYSETYNTEQK